MIKRRSRPRALTNKIVFRRFRNYANVVGFSLCLVASVVVWMLDVDVVAVVFACVAVVLVVVTADVTVSVPVIVWL